MFDPGTVQELDSWGGLGVYSHRAADLDAWIFVALHDDRLGPPTGGTRLKVYACPEDGLIDALRLSRGMTQKWAAIELPFGGGKAVLCLSRALGAGEKRRLLEAYAAILNTLRGKFGTGQDLGTTVEDMRFLAGLSASVHGIDRETGQVEDPGPHTALGVHAAMRSAFKHRFGSDSFGGRTIVIEGVGDVGAPLARMLARDGARLLLVDLDEARAVALARELDAKTLACGDQFATPCDVYAPCATGATLNPETIPEFVCEMVCGSANNQLLSSADAERLHARGILYVPDFVANAGGAAYCSALGTGIVRSELEARVLNIGTIVSEVCEEAAARNETLLAAAERRVERMFDRPG